MESPREAYGGSSWPPPDTLLRPCPNHRGSAMAGEPGRVSPGGLHPPCFIPQGFGVSPGPCQTPPGAGPDLAPQAWQRPVALSPPGFVPLWDNLDLWSNNWGLGVGFSSPEPAR